MRFLALVVLNVLCFSYAFSMNVESLLQPGEYVDGEAALVQRLGLGSDFSFRVEQTRRSAHGLWRNRLDLYYKNIAVRSCSIQASADNDDMYTGAVTGYIPDESAFASLVLSDTLTMDDLKEITAAYVNAEKPNPNGPITAADLENFIHGKEILINDDGSVSLVYNVRALVDKMQYIANPRILIATDGSVIAGYAKVRYASAIEHSKRDLPNQGELENRCPVCQGGNPKINIQYGPDCKKGERCLMAKRRGNRCFYENSAVKVYTLNNSWDRSNARIVAFPCDEGPNDSINGAFSPSSDAFYYAQAYEAMMKDIGNVKQTSASGRPHILYVHYGVNFDNAFFDGHASTFGDGDNTTTYPFTTAEAVGHELGHMYTNYLGNFNFDMQSIVLDEVFADVTGKLLSYYVDNDMSWSFGENLRIKSCDPMRWFDEPTKSGYYVDHVSDIDAGQPFKAMGIFEKFFYSVVAELGYPREIAFELFVHANTLYWQADTDYAKAACGLLQSASDVGIDADAVGQKLSERGFDLSVCNLEGTMDVVVESGNVRRLRRDIQVSKYKKPVFGFKIPDGKSRVTVEATLATGILLRSGENVGINKIVIDGTGVQTVQLSSENEDTKFVNLLVRFA